MIEINSTRLYTGQEAGQVADGDIVGVIYEIYKEESGNNLREGNDKKNQWPLGAPGIEELR